MIKQCGYCYRVYGKDGGYCDIGLSVPIIDLYVAPPRKEKVSVSHAVCPDCFESMIDSLQKKGEMRSSGLNHTTIENDERPIVHIAR